MIVALAFVVLTYITVVKFPSPAPLMVWGFTGIMMFLNMMGYVSSAWLYLMYIFLIAVLMISAIVEANT